MCSNKACCAVSSECVHPMCTIRVFFSEYTEKYTNLQVSTCPLPRWRTTKHPQNRWTVLRIIYRHPRLTVRRAGLYET